MIVIQGKSEKSKVVENLIRKEFSTDNLVIIDAVGVNYWSGADWANIWTLDGFNSYKDVITVFEDGTEDLEKFDWIVFHVNATEEAVKVFKELDRKYSQNFIITIQTNAGITNKYFI